MRRAASWYPLLAACAAFSARPARAQLVQLGGERASLAISGYVRALTGVHDAGFSLAGEPERTGFHAEVVRLKWEARYGRRLTLRVQERLQLQLTSAAGASQVAGFGVTVAPARSVDLESTILEQPRLRVWHDVDRLSLTVNTHAADVTMGRQAISWGTASLFPVADLWAQFSPFELDTEEKPGIDAVRVLAYPGPGLELDAVLADRGPAEDVSAGVRLSLARAGGEYYAGFGKFWEELIGLGGITLISAETRVRGEFALPWSLDADGFQRPRVTVGVDWLHGRYLLTGEYHYQGIGATSPRDYAARLVDEHRARGETYLLGRHYLGATAAWQPDESARAGISLSGLSNLDDPSLALIPLLSYDFGQSTSLSVGALLTWGSLPVLEPQPALRSEYGTYGDMVFSRLSLFF